MLVVSLGEELAPEELLDDGVCDEMEMGPNGQKIAATPFGCK